MSTVRDVMNSGKIGSRSKSITPWSNLYKLKKCHHM